MNSQEKKFSSGLGQLEIDWKAATPGFQIQFFVSGRKKLDLEFGDTYQYYDWASLTKIVATAPLVMRALEKRKLSLSRDISLDLPWIAPGSLRLKNLLSHSNGLTWWKPFYESLVSGQTQWKPKYTVENAWTEFEKILKTEVDREMAAKTIRVGSPCVYSDLDLFLIGSWLQVIFERPLHEIYLSFADELGGQVHFCTNNKPRYSRTRYAPTEDSSPRGGLQQGCVHDENTWSLNGVAPHAGLFGTIDDLARYGLKLRASLISGKRFFGISPIWVQRFAKRAVPVRQGDWAHAFMLPTKGSASCGKYFSSVSVGHTGFTGTSLWYDPKNDWLACILSNRVCPTRENKLFLQLRPRLHDLAVGAVQK